MRPSGLRKEQRRKFSAKTYACVRCGSHRRCVHGIRGLDAHECCILHVLHRPCIEHFGRQMKEKWEESNVATAQSQFVALKKCSPVQGFCKKIGGRILGGTERSTEALGLWTSSLKMLNLKGLESANVAKRKIAKINALKISNPSRVFAVVVKAGSMGATDRSTKSQRLWTSSLRMWKFNRLES